MKKGAIQIIDGKARVVAEKYCDGLGACLGECPQGVSPSLNGLPMIVKNGLEAAGKSLPIRKIVISTSGKRLKEETS